MKKIFRISAIVIFAVLTFVILSNVTPVSFDKYASEYMSEDKILYKTKDIDFGKDLGFIVTSLYQDSDPDSAYYTYSLFNKSGGWFNNKTEPYISVSYDKFSLAEELQNLDTVSTYPEVMTYNGDDKGVFCGLVPIECQSIFFDGVEAELISQSVNLAGEQFDLYFYYLPVDNVHTAEVRYVDVNGNEIQDFAVNCS